MLVKSKRITPRLNLQRILSGISKWLLFVAMCHLVLWIYTPGLNACAMSALISVYGRTLDEFTPLGLSADYKDYNDPWDYFGFIMANSTYTTNADGYGVVMYSDQNTLIDPMNMWYKRVTNPAGFNHTIYTGQYLSQTNQDTDWDHDILDVAMFSILSGPNNPAIVMCHARDATGITYGSHPFWFEYQGRTFTFMHNGNCNPPRSFMINRINQMNPGENWFEQHPSNYFENTNPFQWVDSELFFHFIMSHISQCQFNYLIGLRNALSEISSYLLTYTGTYNFIMSDGRQIYVFRSSPLTGSLSRYKLSYRYSPGQFYAIRTLGPAPNDIELRPRELVVLSRDARPTHYQNFHIISFEELSKNAAMQAGLDRGIPQPFDLLVGPNPFQDLTSIRINHTTSTNLTVKIYNARGEAIWETVRSVRNSGSEILVWEGVDQYGGKVASGVYVLKVTAGNCTRTSKILMLQ